MATTESFRRGPLTVLLVGTFLIVLDFFIVNVALPSIRRDLDAGPAALEWLVAGYGLALGGLLLLASRAGDRWGRRRVFTTGIALFVAASAACGLAPDVETLVAARVLQGAAASAVSPIALALIGDVYAGPQRIRALGAYATVMGLAAVSGQLLGGLLIDVNLAGLGWRSIFLINVPVGLVALVAARRLLPDPRVDVPRPDLLESALVVATLTALVFPLIEGRERGWPGWTWLLLASSVVLGGLALRRTRALRRRGLLPLVHLEPARGQVTTGLVAITALFSGMAAYFLVLALYLQEGRGLGPLASGTIFMAVALPYMAGTRNAATVLQRFGARLTLRVAALMFGAGHALVLLTVTRNGTEGSALWLIPGLAVGGVGMGMALSGLVGVTMGSVEPRNAGTISGISSTLQQVGNAVGVALVGIIYFGRAEHGVAGAFEASLLYLIATTAIVGLIAGRLPGIRRPTVETSRRVPSSEPQTSLSRGRLP